MGSVVNKIINKTSGLRVIATLNNSHLPNLAFPFVRRSIDSRETEPFDTTNQRVPLFDSPNREKVESSKPLPFYPSFPFGYCFKPIYSDGFDQPEFTEDVTIESGDVSTIWADSVKKKRKKKMNKHKYKKLRKRLRRQS